MIKAIIPGFTQSKTTEYVMCLFQAAKGMFQKCKWHQNKCSVSQENLCTTSKEDKKQKLERAKFLFLFTNDGAVIKLMLLPICVTAYTIQL